MTNQELIIKLTEDISWLEQGCETEREIVDHIKMAIEALQAQATLDDVSNAYENGYQQGKFESQQWIPCSDHLPKESGTYFVTAYDGHCKRTSFMKYQKKYQRWDLTGTRTYWQIMAWMPLPVSWEGEASWIK